MAVAALVWLPDHPLAHGGWFAWPAAFITGWILLYEHDQQLPDQLAHLAHAGMVWLLAVVGTWELVWQVHLVLGTNGSWFDISRVVMPVGLTGVILLAVERIPWPLKRHGESYLGLAILPLAVWSLLWAVMTAFSSRGDSWPFTWLPVVNQLDLAMLAAIGLPMIWVRTLQQDWRFRELILTLRPIYMTIFTAVIFIWINSVLGRTLHYWGGVPLNADAMLHSPLAQASFSIFWSLLALVSMMYAVHKSLRSIWITGASLLGVVVLKLFMVDLAGHGTVARIVSFVAVGLLLLVIGWFAPVPPKEEA
jgi:uncharacterized membrane protein